MNEKSRSLLTCAMAAHGARRCNKNKNESASPAATNDTVTITQASPPQGGTWADVVNATSSGGFVMGNPNAKVKLVEYGSLTCPHCKAFDDEGGPDADRQICEVGQGQLGIPQLCATIRSTLPLR